MMCPIWLAIIVPDRSSWSAEIGDGAWLVIFAPHLAHAHQIPTAIFQPRREHFGVVLHSCGRPSLTYGWGTPNLRARCLQRSYLHQIPSHDCFAPGKSFAPRALPQRKRRWHRTIAVNKNRARLRCKGELTSHLFPWREVVVNGPAAPVADAFSLDSAQ